MKHINGAYLDKFDELTTEILFEGSNSIAARIERNYTFSLNQNFMAIYLIRLHVYYVQNNLYNSIEFFRSLFLKIESMGYDNKKDHIVFMLQEEGSSIYNNLIYTYIKSIRPGYDTSNICYADEKLNISDHHGGMLKYLNFVHQCSSASGQLINHDVMKDKLFLTLNRRHKIHRTMLVGSIIEENLLDKSLVSFFPVCEDVSFKNILDWDSTFDIERKHKYYTLLDREFVLDNNVEIINSNQQPVISMALLDLHKRSHFSIICETRFTENDISVTEKTYKAIAYKHPFIILGPQHFLRYVRDLGYKTFHPYINEDYDEIINPVKRFDAVIAEMKRISNLSTVELLQLQQELSHITDYNHRIHNKNFEYLDHKTTLFPYINMFYSNVNEIVNESRANGGILKLRNKF